MPVRLQGSLIELSLFCMPAWSPPLASRIASSRPCRQVRRSVLLLLVPVRSDWRSLIWSWAFVRSLLLDESCFCRLLTWRFMSLRVAARSRLFLDASLDLVKYSGVITAVATSSTAAIANIHHGMFRGDPDGCPDGGGGTAPAGPDGGCSGGDATASCWVWPPGGT